MNHRIHAGLVFEAFIQRLNLLEDRCARGAAILEIDRPFSDGEVIVLQDYTAHYELRCRIGVSDFDFCALIV